MIICLNITRCSVQKHPIQVSSFYLLPLAAFRGRVCPRARAIFVLLGIVLFRPNSCSSMTYTSGYGLFMPYESNAIATRAVVTAASAAHWVCFYRQDRLELVHVSLCHKGKIPSHLMRRDRHVQHPVRALDIAGILNFGGRKRQRGLSCLLKPRKISGWNVVCGEDNRSPPEPNGRIGLSSPRF